MSLRVGQCAALAIAAMGLVASAQTAPTRRAASVLDAVPNLSAVSGDGSASELTIRWNVAESASSDPIPARDLRPLNRFEVLSRRLVASGSVRERAPQLSTEHVVVITVDASGREVGWQQVRDPRVVRAETPDANLELSGQTLYRPVTELLVTLPDALAPAAVRIYEVEWSGTEFVLRELGEVAVAIP